MKKGGQTPVWCQFPISMHRPLPADAQIKWAWLQRRRVGLHYQWSFQVVLAEDTRHRPVDPMLATSGYVAIDVGWRLTGNDQDRECGFESEEHDHLVHGENCPRSGLRVAYWLGDDGREGELRLPARWTCAYYKVRDIGSIRDKMFNEILLRLREWVNANETPEWLPERLQHSHNWKRKGRLAKVALDWRTQRFAGDEEIFAEVEAWRAQDKHLMSYASHLNDQLQRQRADLYRNFVSDLRKRYATAVIENIDMRTLARRKEPEDSHLEKESARRHRRAAAISILRTFLKEKVAIVKVDPAGTSYLCNNCGCASFRGSSKAVHTCVTCGVTWDRDANAVRNILARGLEIVASKKSSSSEAA